MDALTALVRPSGGGRWSKCVGSPMLTLLAGMGDNEDIADNEVREDGTAAHWVNAEVYEGRHPPIDSLSPNARIITEEMYDGCDLWHDVLRSWPNVVPVIEKPVPNSKVIRGSVDGTPDAWAYNPSTRTLYVADYKFGFRFVEVWWNDQLIIYAAGICELLGIRLQDVQLVFVIVQPRSYHHEGPVRHWYVAGASLVAHVAKLDAASLACHQPGAMCTAGNWCHDCPGRSACKTLHADAQVTHELSYDSTPFELTPDQLGVELARLEDAARRLEGRITGLQATAENFIRNQKQVPGYTFTSKQGRLVFKPGTLDQIKALAKLFNVQAFKEPAPRTPTQLASLFPPGTLDNFTERVHSSAKLTRVGPHDIEKQFAKKR